MSPSATRHPARPWRAREREWGSIALAWALACMAFSLWPGIDVAVSRSFLDAEGQFVGDEVPLVSAVYQAVPWLTRGMAVAALLALLLSRLQPGWVGPLARRRAGVTLLALVLGVGLTVNGVLKQGWGRARPVEVSLGGGSGHFEPALRPSEQCRSNCSFVSGHAASGYALAAWGLLGSPARRRRWLFIGAAAGLLIGLGRIAQGGHFASDVVFSGLVIWVCNAALREAWLHVRRRRRRLAVAGRQGAG